MHYRWQHVTNQAAQNNPQPAILHKTGKRSGSYARGFTATSSTCKPASMPKHDTGTKNAFVIMMNTTPHFQVPQAMPTRHHKSSWVRMLSGEDSRDPSIPNRSITNPRQVDGTSIPYNGAAFCSVVAFQTMIAMWNVS